jgi:gallate dioxygenase
VPEREAIEAHLLHIHHELEGCTDLPGTYPFTLKASQDNLKINTFLHDLVKPTHRARFLNDFDALATEFGLSPKEKELITQRQWIEMIRQGVSFFVLEKMAAVLGVSNPEVYAAFRGETLNEFLATRKVPIQYSVSGAGKSEGLPAKS